MLPDVAVPTGRPACEALRSQPCRDFVASRAPTGVTAVVSVSDRDIDVIWAPPASPDPVTRYEVEALPTGETFGVTGSTSFTYPSPNPGVRYVFTVRATFADGDGPPSTPSLDAPSTGRLIDVSPASWYAHGVDWTTAYGLLSAPGGRFRPGTAATRAQVALALWSLMGWPTSGSVEAYADVPDGALYRDAVAWLAEAGIDRGFPDGTFRPDATVTRARLAIMLHRVSGALTSGVPDNTYADVPDGVRYTDAADWWQGHRLTAGGPASTRFKPRATVKRSQLAGWLWNLARTPTAWASGYPF